MPGVECLLTLRFALGVYPFVNVVLIAKGDGALPQTVRRIGAKLIPGARINLSGWLCRNAIHQVAHHFFYGLHARLLLLQRRGAEIAPLPLQREPAPMLQPMTVAEIKARRSLAILAMKLDTDQLPRPEHRRLLFCYFPKKNGPKRNH